MPRISRTSTLTLSFKKHQASATLSTNESMATGCQPSSAPGRRSAIQPIQQFSNTTGKNSSDSALIIDAMDLLYQNDLDAFCIVSSDSDFTRLATRLRESDIFVLGMGEQKTPRAFISACNKFVSRCSRREPQTRDEQVEPSRAQTYERCARTGQARPDKHY